MAMLIHPTGVRIDIEITPAGVELPGWGEHPAAISDHTEGRTPIIEIMPIDVMMIDGATFRRLRDESACRIETASAAEVEAVRSALGLGADEPGVSTATPPAPSKAYRMYTVASDGTDTGLVGSATDALGLRALWRQTGLDEEYSDTDGPGHRVEDEDGHQYTYVPLGGTLTPDPDATRARLWSLAGRAAKLEALYIQRASKGAAAPVAPLLRRLQGGPTLLRNALGRAKRELTEAEASEWYAAVTALQPHLPDDALEAAYGLAFIGGPA